MQIERNITPAAVLGSVPHAAPRAGRSSPTARLARVLIAGLVVLAAVAGFAATGTPAASAASANAGPELTHLLRAMALLKTLFAAAVIGATLWRLAAPVTWPRLSAYAAGCASMAAGPGLIWGLAHVQAGAVLLHGGLLATALLLWRDPATASRLNTAIAARRAHHTA